MSSIVEGVEDQLEAAAQIQAWKVERDLMFEERRKNLPVNMNKTRASSDQPKLKSDLKKSTAFVKKIKAINAEGLQQCIRDAETLNLSLYISEIVTALLEINFKAVDVPGVLKLCALLHARYNDFTLPLVTGLREGVLKPAGKGEDATRVRRIQIRMLLELYQMGLFNDENFLNVLLRCIIGKGKGYVHCSGDNRVSHGLAGVHRSSRWIWLG